MQEKTAYLTIDDSPSLSMIDRVAFLDSRGIHAIWFCRGDYLAERPEAAIRALRSGHILGNHSWGHPYFSKLSLDQAAFEIDRTDELVDELHRQAGVDRRLKVFRFPYEDRIGSDEHHAKLQGLLKSRGFVLPKIPRVQDSRMLRHIQEEDTSLFWTFDSEDWTLQAPGTVEADDRLAKVLARMDRNEPEAGCGLKAPGTEVIVMHDHSHTGAQWQTVVQGFLDRGLVFKGF